MFSQEPGLVHFLSQVFERGEAGQRIGKCFGRPDPLNGRGQKKKPFVPLPAKVRQIPGLGNLLEVLGDQVA